MNCIGKSKQTFHFYKFKTKNKYNMLAVVQIKYYNIQR